MTGKTEEITFSFGENWIDYLSTINEERIKSATADIEDWIGADSIHGKRVIDVGSGSGLSSLCLYKLHPAELISFDYDPKSVEATKAIKEKFGGKEDWQILQGSVLDSSFISGLGEFDIVYSWGVLHHTGQMWSAIENAQRLCKSGGLTLISIYEAGNLYPEHLALKQKYNSASDEEKNEIIKTEVAQKYPDLPFETAVREMQEACKERGMNHYNDLIDWLGGLPYEVAYPSEVLERFMRAGFLPLRVLEWSQGGCSIYLFKKTGAPYNSLRNVAFEWEHLTHLGRVERRTYNKQVAEERGQILYLDGFLPKISIKNLRARIGI